MTTELSKLISKLQVHAESPHIRTAISLMQDSSTQFSAGQPLVLSVSEALEFWSIRHQHIRRTGKIIYGLEQFLERIKDLPGRMELDSYVCSKLCQNSRTVCPDATSEYREQEIHC